MRLAKKVLAVLAAVSLVSGSTASGRQTAVAAPEAAQEKASTESSHQTEQDQEHRKPVPDKAAVKQAQELIKQAYADDYKAAPSNCEPLVQKLLTAASQTDNLVRRYAMMIEAEEVAALGGDFIRAMEVIAVRSREFAEDEVQGRLDRLARLVTPKVKGDSESLGTIYEQAMATAALAAARESLAQAKLAADIAGDAARSIYLVGKSQRDNEIAAHGEAKQASARGFAKSIEQRRNLFAKYEKATEVLKGDPQNPAANETVGRYLCFVRGDWQEGLRAFVKGGRKEIAEAAAIELKATEGEEPDAKRVLEIAQRWWEIAEKAGTDKEAAMGIKLHAQSLYASLEGKLSDPLDAQLATQRAGTAVPIRRPLVPDQDPRTQKAAGLVEARQQKLLRTSLRRLGPGELNAALKVGHGNWAWNGGQIEVYSWTYGLPGVLVFGDVGEDAYLQATMRNAGYAAQGCQGLLVCLTKEVAEDGGYHGSPAYFVRYSNGVVEVLDAVPYHKAQQPPRQLASKPIEVKYDASYTLSVEVRNGKEITVFMDGVQVLEHTADNELRGRLGLLAANGQYIFQNVQAGMLTP